jgi:type IV secretion system protein TrbI
MADNKTPSENPHDMGSLRHRPSKVIRLRRALLPATAVVLGCAVIGSLAYQMIGASAPAPRPERKASTGTAPVMDLPTDYVEQYRPQQTAYAPPAAPSAPAEPFIPRPIDIGQPSPAMAPARPKPQRQSMVVLSSNRGSQPAAQTQPMGSGMMQQADGQQDDGSSLNERFYGRAGSADDMFRPTRLSRSMGACTVMPGYYIHYRLVGEVDTETPGQVKAVTTRPIMGGPRGDCVASPPGATLVGSMNTQVGYGDSRIQVAWKALVLPNHSFMPLDGMPGGSADGRAGLEASVNTHMGSLATAIFAGTIIDILKGRLGTHSSSGVDINIGGALLGNAATVGEKLVDRELGRRPSLEALQQEFTVQVTRPMIFEAYPK